MEKKREQKIREDPNGQKGGTDRQRKRQMIDTSGRQAVGARSQAEVVSRPDIQLNALVQDMRHPHARPFDSFAHVYIQICRIPFIRSVCKEKN